MWYNRPGPNHHNVLANQLFTRVLCNIIIRMRFLKTILEHVQFLKINYYKLADILFIKKNSKSVFMSSNISLTAAGTIVQQFVHLF